MSIQAINWARKVRAGSSSRKFLLIALANYANESAEAYPSTETLANDTEMDRKTVMAGLRDLASLGLIEDSGKRVGPTRGVKVWRLCIPVEAVPKTEQYRNRNSTENGYQAVPKTDSKLYQKRYTEPSGEPLVEPLVRDTLGSRYTLRAQGQRAESAPERRAREASEYSTRYFADADREEERRIAEYTRANRRIEK